MTRTLTLIAGAALGLNGASAQTDSDRAYAAELRADAANRTSLLQAGTAGHDGNFFISDGTGNFRLNIAGNIQFQYNLNFRDDDAGAGNDDDDFTNGFELNRTTLDFFGNVITPDTFFKIRGEFSEVDGDGESGGGQGTFELEDAFIKHHFNDNWYGIAGQIRVPMLWEEFGVDNQFQLAAERSLTNEVFNAGYSQGIGLGYRDDTIGFIVAFDDGAQTNNTTFFGANNEADYAITGRFDWKIQGDWTQFEDFTSFRNTEGVAARIGAGVHWQENGDTGAFSGSTPASTADFGLLLYTVDAQIEGPGWNLFGAFIGRYIDFDGVTGVGGEEEANDFGFVVQGGFFVADQVELFARYDGVFPDDDFYAADEDFQTLTFGGNYYITSNSHAAKFTTDVQIFLDETTDSALVNGGGVG
ncbi:MAG: porin, partial [Planctomycetota bacterium]